MSAPVSAYCPTSIRQDNQPTTLETNQQDHIRPLGEMDGFLSPIRLTEKQIVS